MNQEQQRNAPYAHRRSVTIDFKTDVVLNNSEYITLMAIAFEELEVNPIIGNTVELLLDYDFNTILGFEPEGDFEPPEYKFTIRFNIKDSNLFVMTMRLFELE